MGRTGRAKEGKVIVLVNGNEQNQNKNNEHISREGNVR
jgi:ERCC4-related helicase